MKKLIYLFVMIIATFTLSSCEEKRWQESDLTETEVIEVIISSTDTEAYSIYPKNGFFIYEHNVDLNRYEMVDWNYAEEGEKETITFKGILSATEYAIYEILYSSETKSGRLIIKYFTDDVEQTEKESVQTISELTTTTKFIDLN